MFRKNHGINRSAGICGMASPVGLSDKDLWDSYFSWNLFLTRVRYDSDLRCLVLPVLNLGFDTTDYVSSY